MERDNLQYDEAIDLGAASAETKGPPGVQLEPSAIGRAFGIADD